MNGTLNRVDPDSIDFQDLPTTEKEEFAEALTERVQYKLLRDQLAKERLQREKPLLAHLMRIGEAPYTDASVAALEAQARSVVDAVNRRRELMRKRWLAATIAGCVIAVAGLCFSPAIGLTGGLGTVGVGILVAIFCMTKSFKYYELDYYCASRTVRNSESEMPEDVLRLVLKIDQGLPQGRAWYYLYEYRLSNCIVGRKLTVNYGEGDYCVLHTGITLPSDLK